MGRAGVRGAGVAALSRLTAHPPAARVLPLWMGLVALIVLLLGVLLTSTEPGNRFLDAVSGYRGPIWRDSFTLACDFAFTGIGLSHFEEFYSAYVLLVHVPFLYHAHNLLLDIWLGQGVLGLLSLGGWMVTAMRNQVFSKRSDAQNLVSHCGVAPAFASLGVILIHGWFDDPFYGYGAQLLPLLFVPLGLLTHQSTASEVRRGAAVLSGAEQSRSVRPYPVASVLIFVAIAAFIWLVPSLRASLYANLYANLGALTQARTELPGYTYQIWGVQDNVRRSNTIDLQPAIGYYQEALRLDPANPTAHLRPGPN
ncbi:MAG: hypothetical protein HC853_18650 [Anaerolineae bacterium]|nr:hypothetical protein [Anaerolineae bacterium]